MSAKSHKDLSCPICLEILTDPVKITCGHAFCKSCVTPLCAGTPECPVCRERFSSRGLRVDSALKRKVNTTEVTCPNCQQQMLAKSLRDHEKACKPETVTFDPSKYSERVPKAVPNRSTFTCPYCGETNLTCDDIVKHCKGKHRHDEKQVVCPVCASMPWGDKQQVSSNFIEHLTRRHNFEYDTYVDYVKDEDEMLQEAIQASLLKQ